MSSSVLLPSVALIVAVGVVAQILADRYQVPSVLFLITGGIVLGPEVLGLVTDGLFGGALSTIVGLAVAIIVFEGAFHLKVEKLKEAPSAAFRLVTIGAVVAFLGTAVAVKLAITGATWGTSLLVGALLVATGPTVITPILNVVPVRDRVGAAMETEGIVNDVTAAIAAVVIFETMRPGHSDPGSAAPEFASRLGIGLLVGLVVAAVIWYVLRYVDLSPGNAPRNARLLTLAGAVVAYGAADYLLAEAGVAAVATAGLVLGNVDIPYEDNIEEFKGDVTLIVLSFVFISTTGDRFTRGEKLFISFVGPRGIIPASVATLFAIQLQSQGNTEQAGILVGTVFLVILTTVVFEAGLARQIAEYLDVIPMRVLIVGGGKVGRSLAERLVDRGENVVLIENDESIVERARNDGFTVHKGDGTDTEVLRSAGADNAKIVAAATGDDDANLLVAQLASSKFDVDTVIARANNPDNVDAFEDLGVRTISASMATAWAMDNVIERPALSNWMTELGRTGDVQEIEVTAEDLVGTTITELDEELPNGVLIALVGRDGDNHVPDGGFTLQHGDHITFLGRKEAVREALARSHPHD